MEGPSNPSDRAALIFEHARQLAETAREAYLREACKGDSELRRLIGDLLAAHAKQGGFLAEPTHARPLLAAEESAATDQAGQATTELPASALSTPSSAQIGRYKLLQRIGEGGFGEVWMAEQREPIKRRVALKIIKPGMDSRQVIARFEAERQALAMMDHPNIARVFDAGVTDAGRPYFVMELVRGVPITEYADAENLDPHARLELFTNVCNAVQHAHQKGIIHRDLKPSNVLVTAMDGKPVPKVIDFGIAKATGGELTEKTLFTEFRQFIGTPQYMSPEQAGMSGVDIDTRSDIYSLGVLLYELLTGVTPFDAARLRSAALEEMRRIIREEDPPRPSTRVSTLGDALTAVARRRRVEAARLGTLMRGDLDWITMKCLEKDRGRRYGTASDVAADVQRHLAGEAVIAAPPSRVYRFRRFVRRNRAAVTAAGLVAVTLVLGTIGTSAGFVWADQERRQTETARRAEKREKERALGAETEATKQRNEAARQRDEANRLREAAVFEAYAANVGAALTAVDHGDTSGAQRYLENCPEALRNWEWRYASAACDQSLRTIAMDNPVLTMNPARSQAIASCADWTIRILDSPSMSQLATLEHPAGSGVRFAVAEPPTINLSPDGSRFVSRRSAYEARAILWDAENLREIPAFHTRDDFHGTIRFSPSSSLLLVLDWKSPVSAVHDARSGETLAAIDLGVDHGRLWGAFAADEKHVVIASCYKNNLLRVFRVEDGTAVRSIAAHGAPIAQMIPSPDGTLIVTLAEDGDARIWDAMTLNQLSALSGMNAHAGAVWSPDSRRLALYRDNRLSICDARTGVELIRSDSEAGDALRQFSDDGRKLITKRGYLGAAVAEVWDTTTGRQILVAKRENVYHHFVATFSPDSSHVALSFTDGAIELWDVEHGKLRATVRGHGGGIESLAFSPDGSRLFSTAPDGIREWAVRTPEPIVQLRPMAGTIRYTARFTPDSRRIIAPYPVYQPKHEAADTACTEEDTVSYYSGHIMVDNL